MHSVEIQVSSTSRTDERPFSIAASKCRGAEETFVLLLRFVASNSDSLHILPIYKTFILHVFFLPLPQILEEADDNHCEQNSYRKCSNNRHSLEAVERVLCEEKSDWKEDEQ